MRAAVRLPLLRKDFIVDEYQLLEARANGADAVLLIVAALADGPLRALHARGAGARPGRARRGARRRARSTGRVAAGAEIIGVNNRNLRTLDVDTNASEMAASRIPSSVVAVSESGLRTSSDLVRMRALGYRAFLIGERFMTRRDPGEALRDVLAFRPDRTRRSAAAPARFAP